MDDDVETMHDLLAQLDGDARLSALALLLEFIASAPPSEEGACVHLIEAFARAHALSLDD